MGNKIKRSFLAGLATIVPVALTVYVLQVVLKITITLGGKVSEPLKQFVDVTFPGFNLLSSIEQYPTKKYFFDLVKDYNDPIQIQKNWIPSQNIINRDKKIKFFKTHHANCKINEYAFTSRPNTLATIYIVRDPRNLVQSISNHFSMTITDSKKFLFSPRVIGQKSDKKFTKDDLLTILGSWKDHYTSWVKQNENLLLIKYEDLIKNPNRLRSIPSVKFSRTLSSSTT